MKISKLTNGMLVSLLLSASVVGAESKYPAADFQPKVVYQDSDYKPSKSSGSSSSSKAEVSVADSNFPAANFQPEVLYQDKGYKHKKDNVKASSASASSSSTTSSSGSSGNGDSSESGDSSMSLVLGLIVLAVAGYIFYNKNNIKTTPASRRRAVKKAAESVAPGESSVSGVAKYLESKVGATRSGVSKYLEERESISPVSSVSKYLAKQKISAKIASVTGVEKYLKDRT